MTTHTISGSTFKPDGVNVNVGNWTVRVFSSTGYAFSSVPGNWIGGAQTWTTKTDGSLTITLPETDGSNYSYQASFVSLDKKSSYGPFQFNLTANRTWTDIMTAPSPIPLTPPLITAAQASAAAAAASAAAAATSAGSARASSLAMSIVL